MDENQFSTKPAARTADNRPVRGVRSTVTALALVLAFGFGVVVDRIAWQDDSRVTASSSFTDLQEFQVLQDTWDLIHSEYVDTSAIDNQALIYGAASGMVESLGDTGHSAFFDPDEAEVLERVQEGEFVGIGVQIDYTTGRPVIVSALDDSPAKEAGLRSDDVLLEINGESTEGMTPEQVADTLRGDEGTDVTLTLQHAEEDQRYTVTLTRRVITIEPVTWGLLPDRTTLIRISEFSVGATKGVEEALAFAAENEARAIVLDLRDNLGGLVFEAVGVASQFMPEGKTIYQYQDRDDEPQPVKTLGQGLGRDLPMIVLINGGSASAAEIIAAALRDNGRAELYGEKTFGTGTVLTPFELDDGSVALLGTGLWLTPNGEQIWHIGVAPDFEVSQPAGADEIRPSDDPRVTRAELAASEDEQMRYAHGALMQRLAEETTSTGTAWR
ncbi:MAG: S41 family peptidase [Thermomicrobiales bacterium]